MCETYSKASLGHSVLSTSSTQSDEGAAASIDNPKTEPQIAQHSQVTTVRVREKFRNSKYCVEAASYPDDFLL